MTRKKLFIKSYGCQMNVYDSEKMADILGPEGYDLVDTADDADMVILNTCHIREKAAEKVYSELGRMRLVREKKQQAGKRLTIGVAGCVAQAEGKEMLRRAPVVDMVFGPQSYHRLPEMIETVHKKGHRVLETEFPVEDKFDSLSTLKSAKSQLGKTSRFLTVQEGCDKFCTFCVVPYTRGAEFSRPVADIIADAERLTQEGVKELTLLGQNVNAYNGESPDGSPATLAGLLGALSHIEGIKRLRYTTSHPRDMTDELINIHKDNPKVMPYLHLPIQSGSNAILSAMNRQHDRDEYLKIIERLRAARPDIALSGDFIVGFPGETEKDFEDTLDLVNQVKYAQAYSFKYSIRPGTPAADMEGQVPEDVKSERLERLQTVLNTQQIEFNQSFEGQVMDVLLEREGRRQGQLVGRSPYLQAVHLAADHFKIGDMVQVKIDHGGPNSLTGDIISLSSPSPHANLSEEHLEGASI